MEYTRRLEPYHKFINIENATVEQMEQAFNSLVKEQMDKNIYPIYNFGVNTININAEFTSKPITLGNFVPYHCHDYYEINYVISGSCWQHIQNNTYKMTDGELMILSPGAFHSVYAEPGTTAVNILMKKEYITTLYEKHKRLLKNSFLTNLINEETAFFIFDCNSATNINQSVISFSKIKHAVSGITSIEYSFAASLLRVILYELITEYENDKLPLLQKSNSRTQENKDAQILEYITANLTTITVSDLQKKFGFSRMGLYRFIKNKTGNSYAVYVGSQKLDRAMQMLENTDMNITTIAQSIGFQSKEYFCRFFKKQIHYTPTEFRKIMRERKAKAELTEKSKTQM